MVGASHRCDEMIALQLPDPTVVRGEWLTAQPFPHVVVDHAISPVEAAGAAREFPVPSDPRWHTFTGELEEGKQEGRAEIAGPVVAHIHDAFAGPWFVAWLRELTRIDDLVADPARVGGGIHQSGPGARLGVHVDFNLHPAHADLVRAVNTVLFLDRARDPERTEGWLELWDRGGIARAVPPAPGRLVVFESSDHSWHGMPVPLTGEAALRRTIPCYFYRPVGADEHVRARSTRFLASEADTHG